jgi:hypothetical protein
MEPSRMSYAEKTSVSPEKSKAEIETLLKKYGADQFISGWGDGRAMIGFRCQNRFIRFELPFPDPTEERFTHVKHRGRYFATRRTEAQVSEAVDQEIRRRWRSLALVIKAKLEAVETGITTFENEFLSHIVMPDGRTVGQHVSPRIAEAYESGKMPPLLPGPGETGR